MKKLFIVSLFAIVASIFSSCEKNDYSAPQITPASASTVDFYIDTDSIPDISELLVFLVPSNYTGAPTASMSAFTGKNFFSITLEEKASLKKDAYFTVMVTKKDGSIILNFFPLTSENYLKLSPKDMYESPVSKTTE